MRTEVRLFSCQFGSAHVNSPASSVVTVIASSYTRLQTTFSYWIHEKLSWKSYHIVYLVHARWFPRRQSSKGRHQLYRNGNCPTHSKASLSSECSVKFSVSLNFIAISDFSVHESDLPLLGRQIVVIGGLRFYCDSIFFIIFVSYTLRDSELNEQNSTKTAMLEVSAIWKFGVSPLL